MVSLFVPVFSKSAAKLPYLLFSAALIYYIANPSTVLVLRPQIVFFFVIGVLLAHYPQRLPPWVLFPSIGALAIVAVAPDGLPFLEGQHFDNIVRRPVTAFAFWMLSLSLARTLSRFRLLDRAAFPFFLTHGIVFHLAGSVFFRLGVLEYPVSALALWITTPVFYFAAVYVLWPVAAKKWDAAFASTCGD